MNELEGASSKSLLPLFFIYFYNDDEPTSFTDTKRHDPIYVSFFLPPSLPSPSSAIFLHACRFSSSIQQQKVKRGERPRKRERAGEAPACLPVIDYYILAFRLLLVLLLWMVGWVGVGY